MIANPRRFLQNSKYVESSTSDRIFEKEEITHNLDSVALFKPLCKGLPGFQSALQDLKYGLNDYHLKEKDLISTVDQLKIRFSGNHHLHVLNSAY